MTATFMANLSDEAPPAEMSPPLQAMWWLKKGGLRTGDDWERAHAICQSNEGEASHDLVHAMVHLIEGDTANAAYWYRRAGVTPGGPDLDEEWIRIASRLSS